MGLQAVTNMIIGPHILCFGRCDRCADSYVSGLLTYSRRLGIGTQYLTFLHCLPRLPGTILYDSKRHGSHPSVLPQNPQHHYKNTKLVTTSPAAQSRILEVCHSRFKKRSYRPYLHFVGTQNLVPTLFLNQLYAARTAMKLVTSTLSLQVQDPIQIRYGFVLTSKDLIRVCTHISAYGDVDTYITCSCAICPFVFAFLCTHVPFHMGYKLHMQSIRDMV